MKDVTLDKTYTERVYTLFDTMLKEAHKAFFEKKYKEVPDVVFAVDWHCRESVLGYCAPYAFKKTGDKTEEKVRIQFIAINPSLFSEGFKQVFGTFVHELCHLYESKYIGIRRNNYHSKDWEDLMRSCGLDMIFASGRQGASTVVPEEGIFTDFVSSFEQKYKELTLPFENNSAKLKQAKNKAKNKIKYTCLCKNNVWGKSGLRIYCTECDSYFIEEEQED